MTVNRGRRALLQIDEKLFGGFQVTFDITKTVKKSPRNKARINLYNVSDEVYEQTVDRNRDAVIRLYAGYEVPGLVFTGNPVKNGLKWTWQGADKILTIEAQDGYRAYQKARLSQTLDADAVTMEDLAALAARSLGLPVGTIDLGDFEQEFSQGMSVHGHVGPLLDRIAASTGADWSIQNGTLQILPKNKVRRNSGPLYSSELKNIQEYPQFTDEGIKLKVFLDPSIEPGDRYQLATGDRRYDGIYKAHTVQHSGDLRGQTWATEIEGRPWTQESGVAKAAPPQVVLASGGAIAVLPDDVQQGLDELGWNIHTQRSAK